MCLLIVVVVNTLATLNPQLI